jgi:hypothetical protein
MLEMKKHNPNPFTKLLKGEKAVKFILASNCLIKPEEVHSKKDYLSEEELYYIATSVSELESIRLKRAVFDMVHYQCDEDSVARFLNYFSEDSKKEIMLSC